MAEGARGMEERLRWYEAREYLLDRINPELNSVIDVDKFLVATVNELGKMMGVDKCDFIAFDDDGYLRLRYEYRVSPSIPSTLGMSFPVDASFRGSIGVIVASDVAHGRLDPRLRLLASRTGTVSLLCLPVMFRDELLGMILFHYCHSPHSWSDEEVNFLSSLVKHTAIALQYTRLYTRLEKEAEITKSLLDITNEINSKLDFSEVTSFVLRKAVELLKASYGWIGVLDSGERSLKIAGIFPPDAFSLKDYGSGISLGESYYNVIMEKKPLCLVGGEFVGTLPGISLSASGGGGAALLAPIVLEGKAYGTLSLIWDFSRSHKEFFKPHEIELVTGITNQMALALEKNRLSSEVTTLRSELYGGEQGELKMVGVSSEFEKVVELARSVMGSDVTVLLQGETGTGKELIADFIQRTSARKGKPYIKINCGAIPETLIESELFGYEKGAFTGAKSTTIGKFELADGGTIFLDEIGVLSLNAQVKLLRVLQNGEIFRIGGAKPIKVDVRVIAATNVDLEEAVKKDKFRSDLFYRLNVFPIKIPPLRKRVQDIPLLVLHFIEMYKKKSKKLVFGIADDAMTLLKNYSWPGNIRELENVIERAVITCTKRVITVEDLPPNIVEYVRADDNNLIVLEVGSSLEDAERHLIKETMRYTGGDKKRTAQLLGITRKTLYRKLEEYGLG